MRHCQDKLPGYSIAYIGISLSYSYELLKYDCVSHFNLLQGILVGPRGARFIHKAHAKGRAVLVWTVNTEEWMDWSIRAGVDGVITDDPPKFSRIRKRWEQDGSDGEDDKGSRDVDKFPPTAHPPDTKTVTGFFLRRWTRLYIIVGLVRVIEQLATNFRRARYGWEGERIRAALDQ